MRIGKYNVNLEAFEGKTIDDIKFMLEGSNIDLKARDVYKHLKNKGKKVEKKRKKSEE